jgi:hypothetical protein
MHGVELPLKAPNARREASNFKPQASEKLELQTSLMLEA